MKKILLLSIALMSVYFSTAQHFEFETTPFESEYHPNNPKNDLGTNTLIWVEDSVDLYYYNYNDEVLELRERRITTERNTDGQPLSQVYYQLDLENGLKYEEDITLLTYHSNGVLETVVYFPWDYDTQAWGLDTTYIYAFNEDDLITYDLIRSWDRDNNQYDYNDYSTHRRRYYSYNQDNFLSTEITHEYNDTIGIWVPSKKHEYTYPNGNDLVSVYPEYHWNVDTEQWQDAFFDQRKTLIKDANGNVIEDLKEIYVDGMWVNKNKFTYEYINGNQLANYTYYSWDETTSDWQPFYRRLAEYDINNNIHTSTFEVYRGDGIWQPNSQRIYYYSVFEVVSTDEPLLNSITILPNPNKGVINIQGYEDADINLIQVVNLSGQTIYLSKEMTNQIDISDQADGIYFLILKTNKGSIAKKIIKE